MSHSLDPIAAHLGLGSDDLIPYGRKLAKVSREILDRPATGKGRLILVTALTPTPAGEGKTTTSIGLTQALHRMGHKAIAALREPSLGPCFGVKGGGTGGGKSKLEPSPEINLHCTGDLHAITAANNLLSALIDAHIHFRKTPRIDPRKVAWRRVVDVNDRALRSMVTGLAGQGLANETGFDITAASEVMAILALAESEDDLRARLARIIVAFDEDRNPVTAEDLKAVGAMMALLRDALDPNLVQTTEGAPALVHAGPFANIAHGCSSVIGTRMSRHLADWVITEAGFGADLGAEKFMHIKCRQSGLRPDGVVVVATIRALKMHGGVGMKELTLPNPEAVAKGMANLNRHLDSIGRYGFTPVVAINRFYADTDEELDVVVKACAERGIQAVPSTHFADGGAGAEALAQAVIQQVTQGAPPHFTMLYADEDPIPAKLKAVVQQVYGGADVVLEGKAKLQLGRIKRLGLEHLPICMSKTQNSVSDNPKLRGAPEGFTVTVRELLISAGAGFIVALAVDLVRMPGLGRVPQAVNVDLVDGEIQGVG